MVVGFTLWFLCILIPTKRLHHPRFLLQFSELIDLQNFLCLWFLLEHVYLFLCLFSLLHYWSEDFCRRAEQKYGYWIRLARYTRICNARSDKVGSSYCYLDRRTLHEIDEIVYEYDRKQFHRLVYMELSRIIFNTLFNTIISTRIKSICV